jgi:Xaa-Pro dipeptidase
MRVEGVDALLLTVSTSRLYFSGIPWGATERLVAMMQLAQDDPVDDMPDVKLPEM